MENLLFLGVPVFKHITVSQNFGDVNVNGYSVRQSNPTIFIFASLGVSQLLKERVCSL